MTLEQMARVAMQRTQNEELQRLAMEHSQNANALQRSVFQGGATAANAMAPPPELPDKYFLERFAALVVEQVAAEVREDAFIYTPERAKEKRDTGNDHDLEKVGMSDAYTAVLEQLRTLRFEP